jgi:small subunit ribosomal protein S9
MEIFNATGRRKAAIARVYVTTGKGEITINGKDYKQYFPLELLQYVVTQPLKELELEKNFDIKVRLKGGGIKGQAEALRLGISRALIKIDEDYRPPLKKAGFLTRDARVVERKKYGQPKARKNFQFSKR